MKKIIYLLVVVFLAACKKDDSAPASINGNWAKTKATITYYNSSNAVLKTEDDSYEFNVSFDDNFVTSGQDKEAYNTSSLNGKTYINFIQNSSISDLPIMELSILTSSKMQWKGEALNVPYDDNGIDKIAAKGVLIVDFNRK